MPKKVKTTTKLPDTAHIEEKSPFDLPVINDIVSQVYEIVPIDAVVTWENSPNRGNVDAIEESIDANGFFGACYVQRSSGRIVAGNHRHQAAMARGMETIPVIWLDIDDDRAFRIFLADNKTRDNAAYDNKVLAEMLGALKAKKDGLKGTGFDETELAILVSDLQPKFAPNLNPTASHQEYTPADMARVNIQPVISNRTTVEVYCPHCSESFFLDPNNMEDWKPK